MRNPFRKFICIYIIVTSTAIASGQVDTTDITELFKMSLSDLMNQEIITASKFVQRSAQAASSVSIITADDIRNFNYSTLGEALNSQRGMYLSNDKNYLYVGSRGFSRPTDYNNRIVIMIDGHILNDVVWGSAFMGNEIFLNMQNVEKIEIIRGPGASLYGSGAMLNTVNVITKKGSATDGVLLSAGTGSYGKNELSAVYGKKINNVDISVSGGGGLYQGEDYYFRDLDAPETNFGISRGMDWEKYAGVQTGISGGNFKFIGGYTTRYKGVPTGAWNADLEGDVYTMDNRCFLEASYRKEMGNKNLLLARAYYDNYQYDGSYPRGGEPSYDESTGRWAGAEVQYYTETGARNSIISGLEFRHVFLADYTEWDNYDTYFRDNFPYSSLSCYIHDQFTLVKNLILTAGLRYNLYSNFGHALSPRAAMVYEYSKASSVKLLYSEAFRIPNVYEGFYEYSNTHKINPDIRPEKIRAIELAWGHKISEWLHGSLSLYRFSLIDLIDAILDEQDGLTQFRNIDQARGTGLEVEMRFQSSRRNNGFLSLSLQKAMDPESETIRANSPEILIKSGYTFPVGKYLNCSPEFFYESERYTLSGSKTDEVYLMNLSLRTMTFFKHFDIAFQVKNLFNRKYYYPAGYEHQMDALIQNSRSILVQLNAKF